MQQESAIQAIKNIMKMLDITPEQLQDNSQSTPEQKKEPILVTEDGVVIYDNQQKLYGVEISDIENTLYSNLHDIGIYEDIHEFNWFSTSEARDEYINNHRKMYSLNQIKEAYVNAQGQNNMPDWDTFKYYIH